MNQQMSNYVEESFKVITEEIMKKDGYLEPVTFMVKDNGLAPIPELTAIFKMGKDIYAQILKGMVKDMQPDAVIIVNEIYYKKLDVKDGGKYDNSKSCQEQGGMEAVMINIETRDKQTMLIAPIIRNSANIPSLGKWDKQEMSKENVSGRFMDFFNTSNKLAVPDLEIEAMNLKDKKMDIPKIDA